MDTRNIMRQGPAWNIGALSTADQHLIVEEFHRLARLHGSQAIWIAETGEVVSNDPSEAAKALPYEEWALAAYRHIHTVWEHVALWEQAGDTAPPYGRLH